MKVNTIPADDLAPQVISIYILFAILIDVIWSSKIIFIDRQRNLVEAMSKLTHCGLVTPGGDIDLGQHWLRQWLVAWRHQAITWTNVDLSSLRSCGIHLTTVSQQMPYPSIPEISFESGYLKFYSDLPGANELTAAPGDGFAQIGAWASAGTVITWLGSCTECQKHSYFT